MTRRERLEQRLERREKWAESRDHKSSAAFDRARSLADTIPFGQPILVGHHSERHARRDQDRIHAGMSAGVESAQMAEHHRSKADGIERQLERSVFSDDADAIEKLEERIAALSAQADRNTLVNKAYKKAPGDPAAKLVHLIEAGTLTREAAFAVAKLFALCPYEKQPHPAYENANLRKRIATDRQRIEQIVQQRKRSEQAKAAGGVTIEGEEWIRVTFAEKPERSVLDALKLAGFRWSGGSWIGRRDALPAEAAP